MILEDAESFCVHLTCVFSGVSFGNKCLFNYVSILKEYFFMLLVMI